MLLWTIEPSHGCALAFAPQRPCRCLTRLDLDIVIIINTTSQEKTHTLPPKTPNDNSWYLPSTFYQYHDHAIATQWSLFIYFQQLKRSNIGGHSRRHQMVCHTHYPHNKHPKKHPHGQYYHPNWTIFHFPNANPYVHAMNSLNCHLTSHLAHAQQTKIGKPPTTDNSHLGSHKYQPNVHLCKPIGFTYELVTMIKLKRLSFTPTLSLTHSLKKRKKKKKDHEVVPCKRTFFSMGIFSCQIP